jgi:methionyl-tRNA formyltransferase
VLDAAPRGALNVHASLLPRWRGASPVQAAILAGDAETGVSIMRLDEGMDTGPVLARRAVRIGDEETAGQLGARLAELGGELLAEVLPGWLAGELAAEPQDDALATHAPKLAKADGALDWRLPTADLARRVRGLDPWPGAFFVLPAGERVKVLRARRAEVPSDHDEAPAPGALRRIGGAAMVATGDGWLTLGRVQPAGRGPMDGDAFLRGRPELDGATLPLPSPATAAAP